MDELAIHASKLTRDFKTVRAVNELDLAVQKGTVFGLLGPNGAGKTTTIHLLLGLIKPTAGSCNVFGLDPARHGSAVRARTGCLLEHHGLYERLSVERNLDYYGRINRMSPADRRERIRELLEFNGLWDRRGELAGKLSKGMKQKVAIARALLHRPPVVFLDEPTAGHDPAAAKDVRDYVRDAAKEDSTTFFLTTHNLTEAEQICDRIGVIQAGRLVAEGTPLQLRGSRRGTTIVIEGHGWNGKVLDALRREPYVDSVTATATRIEIHAGKQVHAAPFVTRLVKAGAQVEQVRRESLSLEAAYIALTGRGP